MNLRAGAKKLGLYEYEISDNINLILNDNGLFRLYPMFPFEDSKGFEMLFIEMD